MNAGRWRLRWGMIAYAVRAHARIASTYVWNRRVVVREHRRPLWLCLFFVVSYPLFAAFTAVCLLLDDLVFWGHSRTALQPPLFIVGNPRSGTTLLHRLLAKDRQRFHCFYLWEVFFPAILQQRIIRGVGAFDRLLGSPIRKWLERAEQWKLRDTKHMHSAGLFLPEEDDRVLYSLLATCDLSLLFPASGFEKLLRFDECLPELDQMALMDFFESCAKRHAVVAGRDRTLLSKNPLFTGRIRALDRRFPQGRYIYLVRHPFEVTGSVLNSTRTTMRLFFREEPARDLDFKVFEMIRQYYLDGLAKVDQLPPERVAIVCYDDLITKPHETIQRVYDHFGFTLSPEFAATVDTDIAQMKSYQSKHQYNLDDTPITPQQIVDELYSVFARFGFDTRGVQLSATPATAAVPSGAYA